jgi:hypothetical protein
MVFPNNPFVKRVGIGDVDVVVPADDAIGVGPTILVSVLLECVIQQMFVAFDLNEQRVGVIFNLVATNVFWL